MKIVYQEEPENKEQEESVLNPEKTHLSDLSKKERRLLEKEKLSQMGILGKLEYIWMYYKAAFFGLLMLVIAVFVGWDVYQNAKIQDILNVFVINGAGIDAEGMQKQALEVLEADPDTDSVVVNTSLNTGTDGTSLIYASQMVFVTQLQVGTIDVMVMPETLYNELHEEGMFVDMEELLGNEAADFQENLEVDCLKFKNTEIKDVVPLGYESVCVAVPATSQNKENAAQWITKLF